MVRVLKNKIIKSPLSNSIGRSLQFQHFKKTNKRKNLNKPTVCYCLNNFKKGGGERVVERTRISIS